MAKGVVSRELYEQEKERRQAAESRADAADARYAALVDQMVNVRRHQEGMEGRDAKAADYDVMGGLGTRTQMAIEEFAAGDPQLRRDLIARARLEYGAREGMDEKQRDVEVAQLVSAGDTD